MIRRKRLKAIFSIISNNLQSPKKIYQAYNLGRGSVVSMASPTFLMMGLRTLSHRYTPGVSKGDVMQMPGVFLIDTSGNIRYVHYSKDSSDNPPIETLLALKDIFWEKVARVEITGRTR